MKAEVKCAVFKQYDVCRCSVLPITIIFHWFSLAFIVHHDFLIPQEKIDHSYQCTATKSNEIQWKSMKFD